MQAFRAPWRRDHGGCRCPVAAGRLAGQYVDTLRILMGEWRGLWWPLVALAADLRDWQWMQHDGLFGARRNLPPEVYLSDIEEPPTAADAPLATATDVEET